MDIWDELAEMRALEEADAFEEPPRTAGELDALLPNDNRASRFPRFKTPAERRFHRWEQTAGGALTKREVDFVRLVMGLKVRS